MAKRGCTKKEIKERMLKVTARSEGGSAVQYLPRSSRFGRKGKGVNFKRLGLIVFLAVFLIGILACVRYYSLFAALKGSAAPAFWRPDSGERQQLFLAGRYNNRLTACTLISIPANPQQPVYVIRIPPSTLLEADPEAISFEEAYARESLEAALQGLEALLANRLPVSHYLIYDVQGIGEILTSLESVKIELPQGFQVRTGNTDYIFPGGETTVTLDSYLPLLAAESAFEDKVFWAEKSLLVEVFNQLFSLKHISYFVRNLGSITDGYDTDLTSRQLGRFRDTLQALTWEELNYLVLPGRWLARGEQRYWSSEEKGIALCLNQVIDNIPGYDKFQLIVDVFNGNGVSGFAARTADKLREINFTVGQVGNADTTEITRIYYREEYLLAAMEISMHLDVDAVLIQDRYRDSDNPIALVLGLDMAGR